MGDLGSRLAVQPQEAAREHHHRTDELRGHDAVAAQKCQQKAGETAEEEPRTQDLSIVMRTMQQPQQEDEKRNCSRLA